MGRPEDDTAATAHNRSLVLNVLANDLLPANGTRPVLVTAPAYGTATVLDDSTIRYTPAPGFSGEDSFTYTQLTGGAVGRVANVRVETAAPLTLTRRELSSGRAGSVYDQAIAAEGGFGGVSVTSAIVATEPPGDLGLKFVAGGVLRITGTPTRSGTVTFDVTAADAAGAAVTRRFSVSVVSGPVAGFDLVAPSFATIGRPVQLTARALDAFGNVATSYTGRVQLSRTDPSAGLPASVQLIDGVGTFEVTFGTPGRHSILLLAPDVGTFTPRAQITVSGEAVRLAVTTVRSTTGGERITVTVRAIDRWGNTATGYHGTVRFTSSDASAALPPDSYLIHGVGTFTIVLRKAGKHTIRVTDALANGAIGAMALVDVRDR